MRARKILRIHRARESGGGEILARISKPGGTTRSSNDSFLGATNNTSHRRNTVRAFDSRIDIEREGDYRFENRDVEKDVYVGRMLGYLDPTVRSISRCIHPRHLNVPTCKCEARKGWRQGVTGTRQSPRAPLCVH